MKIRRLELKDAPYMLEWMHDDDIVYGLATDFTDKNLVDCEDFIKKSSMESNIFAIARYLHLAIVDEDDIYMGTVSIKNIDHENAIGEFAITVRKEAMGKGFAQYGMKKIIQIGLDIIGLKKIYWCVNELNKRALRFYDKSHYIVALDIPNILKQNYIELMRKGIVLRWYCVEAQDIRNMIGENVINGKR